MRIAKNRNVSESLASRGSYRGRQDEVWSRIDDLHQELGTQSRTGAMRDAFESMRQPLENSISKFPLMPNQNGILVCIDGLPVGMDVVSRKDAYARLHQRFLKSYVIGSLARPSTEASTVPMERANDFLSRLAELDESTFASPGHGRDFRYSGPTRCGSALVHEHACVHAAFFADIPAEDFLRHMAAMRDRAHNRRREFRM